MCKIFEEMVVETRAEEAYRFALKMLERGEDPLSKIAELTDLTIDDVKEIAEENNITVTV